MNLQDSHRRFSQAIVDAAKPADEDQARKNQTAAALVVNSVGSMVTPKTVGRVTQFDAAADFLGAAIQKARAAKQVEVATNASKKEVAADQPAKTLAELLVEAQDSE
jgi:hypothetical protein